MDDVPIDDTADDDLNGEDAVVPLESDPADWQEQHRIVEGPDSDERR